MSTAHRTDVDIQVASESAEVPDDGHMIEWISTTIEVVEPDQQTAVEVALRVVDETEMQRLNRDFRGKDRVTNVLSFPAGSDEFLPPDLPKNLGDIVICAPVVISEANEQGKAPEAHWAHLLVHGTLHLLGYDHVEAAEAEAMEALEVRILSQRGIADPYTL